PWKQRAMHVDGRVASNPTNHDPPAILLPLENGTRTDSELPAHFGRHRDLTLCRELRLRARHPGYYYPGNVRRATPALEGGRLRWGALTDPRAIALLLTAGLQVRVPPGEPSTRQHESGLSPGSAAVVSEGSGLDAPEVGALSTESTQKAGSGPGLSAHSLRSVNRSTHVVAGVLAVLL